MNFRRLALLLGASLLVSTEAARGQNYQPSSGTDDSPSPVTYSPGHGLSLGDSGVTLAGYWNVNYQDLRNRKGTVNVDDLSLFGTYNPTPHWQAFTEVELEDAVNIDEDGNLSSGTAVVDLERLYVEYRHSDALRLRVGKFLTPIGIWNPIHAAPLVWTVSRPATTEDLFDPATTGVMVAGTRIFEHLELDYTAYAQVTDQLVQREVSRSKRRAGGWRLALRPAAPLTVGLSSEFMKNEKRGRWEHTLGGDLRYDGRRIELWSEAAANTPLAGGRTEWGLYSQAAIQVYGDLFAVGRLEHIKLERSANALLIGLNFRPLHFLVLKAEYLFADRPVGEVRRGLSLSVAGLF